MLNKRDTAYMIRCYRAEAKREHKEAERLERLAFNMEMVPGTKIEIQNAGPDGPGDHDGDIAKIVAVKGKLFTLQYQDGTIGTWDKVETWRFKKVR